MININKSERKGAQSTMVDDNRNSPLSRHLKRRRTLFGKIKPSARCAGINSPAKSKIAFSKERNSPGVSVQSLPLRRLWVLLENDGTETNVAHLIISGHSRILTTLLLKLDHRRSECFDKTTTNILSRSTWFTFTWNHKSNLTLLSKSVTWLILLLVNSSYHWNYHSNSLYRA